MASEADLTSDSDEGYSVKLADRHVKDLKEKLKQQIDETDDLSAEIVHEPGKPAKLVMAFCIQPDQTAITSRTVSRRYTKLLAKNLPDTADEEYLEMFFEHTKRQGGGPVKQVELYRTDKFAIIDFEKSESVDEVLKKVPITMRGETIEVEKYEPYLDRDESLQSIEFSMIPKELSTFIAEMKVTDLKKSDPGPTPAISLPLIEKAKLIHYGVKCNGCGGLKAIVGPRFRCNRCFPDFNLCINCKSNNRHDPSHTFTRLDAGHYPPDFIHIGFRCDGCRTTPIAGARFRCKNCPSFDYCAACMTKKDKQEHNPLHTFFQL